jgi:hypothetical protein
VTWATRRMRGGPGRVGGPASLGAGGGPPSGWAESAVSRFPRRPGPGDLPPSLRRARRGVCRCRPTGRRVGAPQTGGCAAAKLRVSPCPPASPEEPVMIALLRRIVQRLIRPLRRTGTLPLRWRGMRSPRPGSATSRPTPACRASPGLPGEAEPVSAALLAPPPVRGWVVVVNAAAGRRQGEALGADPRHRERRRPSGERAPGDARGCAGGHDRRRGGPRPRLARRAGGVGGDGTLNTVARAAMAAGVAFSAIPQGTFNYFGRCHGFPPTRRRPWRRCWRPAAAGAGGPPQRTDLSWSMPASASTRACSKTGRPSSGSGAQPAGGLAAPLTLLGPPPAPHPPADRRARGAGAGALLTSSTVFVANNRLQLEQVGCRRRSRWRPAGWWGGAPPLGRGALFGLALQGALGRLGEADAVERLVFRRLQIEPGRRWWRPRDVAVAIDGETVGCARRWSSMWPESPVAAGPGGAP